jgi:hypothetical protein
MSPVIPSESESDTDEGGWPVDSGGVRGSDSSGDADIEQLIAPTKRLVVSCIIIEVLLSEVLMSFGDKLLDGDLHLYGSFSPFAHDKAHKHSVPLPKFHDPEDYNSRYVLMVDGANSNHTNSNFDWARHLPHDVPLHRPEHDKYIPVPHFPLATPLITNVDCSIYSLSLLGRGVFG